MPLHRSATSPSMSWSRSTAWPAFASMARARFRGRAWTFRPARMSASSSPRKAPMAGSSWLATARVTTTSPSRKSNATLPPVPTPNAWRMDFGSVI